MDDWPKLPHLVFHLKRSSEEPATAASDTVEPSTSTATPTGTSVIVKPSTSGNLHTVVVQEVHTQEESTAPSSSTEDAGEMVTETVVCNMQIYLYLQLLSFRSCPIGHRSKKADIFGIEDM